MDVTQIRRVFRVLGKTIWYSQRGPEYATTFRKLMSGVVDQTVSGLSDESEAIVKFLTPFCTSIDAVVRSLDGVSAQATRNAELYMKHHLAPQLGLTPAATMPSIGIELITVMNSMGQTVMNKGSGTPPSNSAGFAWFLEKTWGIQLPQSAAPAISDAWISSDVIAD